MNVSGNNCCQSSESQQFLKLSVQSSNFGRDLSFHLQLTQYNHFEKSYCLTETRCEVTYFVRVKILGCYSSWSLLLQFNCWYNSSKLSFAKNRIHFFVLNHVHLNSIIKTNTVGLIWFGLCCHMLLPFPSVHQI